MIQKVFSVYDTKAEAYLPPFFAPNGAVACRYIERAVNDENTDFHRHAPDYVLFEVGSFDSSNGLLSGLDKQVNLGVLTTFIKGDK